MRKIRKGDTVVVLAGRSRGHRGAVKRVISGAGGQAEHVIVEGAQMVVKHVRPNPQLNEPGGRQPREAKIHISNVGLYNPDKQKQDRVRIQHQENGKKIRVFVSGGKEV